MTGEVRTASGSKPGDESPVPELGLFEGFGVEIEYMIVDSETLDVRPVADRLMASVSQSGASEGVGGDASAGSVAEPAAEVEFGAIAWSNELVLHVLEMKTNGPAPSLAGLAERFHEKVRLANEALAPLGCRLLPGGMHPWMDPLRETLLWPHEYTEVYRTFDRIFSCRGHGWANLQSTHLNLPFRGDREFAALHTAVRALLPILPAIAASSPILDGQVAREVDRRMVEYRRNARRVPSVTGLLIPEPVESREEYEREILARIYRDMEPLDPDGVLRHEWVNARGAIARFDRGALEVRVLDPQECPAADLAVVRAVARTAAHLCDRVLAGDPRLLRLETMTLAGVMEGVIRDGETASVESGPYLEALGLEARGPVGRGRARTAREIWEHLLEATAGRHWEAEGGGSGKDPSPDPGREPGPDAGQDAGQDPGRDPGQGPGAEGGGPLRTILDKGPLARRILSATGRAPDRARLGRVYRELSECLRDNRTFDPGP